MRNSIQVEATDDNGQFSTIFYGEIYTSQPEWGGMPDVPFVAVAQSGLIGSLSVSNSASYPGAQKVSLIMEKIAAELGLKVENNGVDSTVTDMSLIGSPIDKMYTLAAARNIQVLYLPAEGVISIAPMGTARDGDVVSYDIDTGLVGFPTKTHNGVAFTALFNPATTHGRKVKIQSAVSACNGEWYVISMSHKLDAEVPGGAWFTNFVVTPQNFVPRTR
jgi:hypothetical protein